MRKTALFACLSLSATALAAQTNTTDKFANQADHGLKIVLLPPSPKMNEPLRYRLSEPAYVAAFMVYPGSGVRQLYPLVDAPERLQRAGYNVNQLIGRSFDDDSYRVVLGPNYGGPSYLYVIASRHPLDVARFVHRPMRLASTIGDVDARSFYADVAFDALVNNAVSLGDDESWDADVYVVWPKDVTGKALAARGNHHVGPYTLMMCSDGIARAVPYNYPFAGCSGDLHVRAKSDASKPVVRKTASAAAVAPASSGGAAGYAGSFDAPTVLPTIIGKRVVEADRGGPPSQGDASKPVMYTMANGDQAAPVSSVNVAPGVQIETMDGGYAHRRSPDRTDVNGRASDRRHEVERQGRVVGGSPQLAPNPKLSPNPELSPNPTVSPTPAAVSEPRNEARGRAVREPMRVPPPPPLPRHEAPAAAKP